MEEYSTLVQTIALTMGVAWASGLNLYGTLLALGIMSNTGYVDLPTDLQIIGDPLVIAAAGLMYGVEFFADKVPGVDTGWDTLHTFVRIPAGALLRARPRTARDAAARWLPRIDRKPPCQDHGIRTGISARNTFVRRIAVARPGVAELEQ